MGSGVAKLEKREEATIEKIARLFRSRANNETFFYKVYVSAMARSRTSKGKNYLVIWLHTLYRTLLANDVFYVSSF